MARVPEADELYGVPLDEFVAARTALAKRLRVEGRGDDAAEVGGLRKPPVPLWAANQVARRRPDELRALLDATDALRAGRGGDEELRRATTAIAAAVREVLDEAGHAASDATVQRATTTLRAAAASAGEEREALERGALDRELEPTGFEAMAAFAGAAPGGRAKPAARDGRDAAKRRERVEAAEAELREAKARARELRREADEVGRAAERARLEADRADTAAEKAERALSRARSR